VPTGLTVATLRHSLRWNADDHGPNGIPRSPERRSIPQPVPVQRDCHRAASGQYTNTTGNVTSTNGGTQYGYGEPEVWPRAYVTNVRRCFHSSKRKHLAQLTINIRTQLLADCIAFTDNCRQAWWFPRRTASPALAVADDLPRLQARAASVLSGATLASTASALFSVNVTGTTAAVKTIASK